ncbi:MAG TPA: hypothetical protein VG101_01680 [Puia sp.]|jgi:hypothetical protein|nr:hypothetical protein [Puia sp.]
MKKRAFVFFLVAGILTSCQVRWENATKWTLYGYQGSRLFKIPIDSLKMLDTVQLNQDSVTSYLSSAKVVHPKEPFLWMGGYVTTCSLNGHLRKVEFSNYGNFFYDENEKHYYQLSSEKAESWLAFVQNNLLTLARKKVITPPQTHP